MAAEPRIRIESRHRAYKLDVKLLKRLVKKVLRSIGKPGARLDFVFLDDRSIRALNKRYKKKDRSTDVLCFDLGGLGTVAISLDTACANSARFGTTLAGEAVLYVIHAILHLYGYNDQTPSERLAMSKKESSILEGLCRTEDLSKVLTPR